jgi:hypothetical protein|tara:strand:+ start:156 stop:353 length:198 start_codon:yes stop_codon:yes gene_type:complete
MQRKHYDFICEKIVNMFRQSTHKDLINYNIVSSGGSINSLSLKIELFENGYQHELPIYIDINLKQ